MERLEGARFDPASSIGSGDDQVGSAGLSPEPGCFDLAGWRVDPSLRRVSRGTRVVTLEPKVLAVLLELARRPGRVVPRQELLDRVWQGRFVGDEVLTRAVFHLRRAFDDSALEPHLFETICRGGYRLMVAPRPLDDSVVVPRKPARPREAVAGRNVRASRPWRGTAWASLAIVIALALVASQLEAPAVGGHGAGSEAQSERLVARAADALESGLPGAESVAGHFAAQAVSVDAGSAAAWGVLSRSWAARVAAGDVPPSVGYPEALAAAQRGLSLDPNEPFALVGRAVAQWLGEWRWDVPERDLSAAAHASPDWALPRILLAQMLFFRGEENLARALTAEALLVEATSIPARLGAGMMASLSGRDDEAVGHYRVVLQANPGHPHATRQLAKAGARDGEGSRPTSSHQVAGWVEKGRIGPALAATLHAEAGEPQKAFEWLDRAVADRDATILYLRFDPRWEPFRAHPRYKAAMDAVGPRSDTPSSAGLVRLSGPWRTDGRHG